MKSLFGIAATGQHQELFTVCSAAAGLGWRLERYRLSPSIRRNQTDSWLSPSLWPKRLMLCATLSRTAPSAGSSSQS